MAQSNGENPTDEDTVTKEDRLSLPREVCQAGFEPGSRVYIHVENDGALRLETQDQKAARVSEPALTGDQAWKGLDLDGIEVQLIR